MPVLADFAEALGLANPPMIVAEPTMFVPSVTEFMADQRVDEDDYDWILVRLGYFIGEVLSTRYGGYWFLNEIPDSRYFGRYVVGRFTRASNPHAQVDPMEIASSFLAQPLPRSLSRTIEDIAWELANP